VSVLLMSDCGFECEQMIMGHDLEADIIKIAHNGANDATSQELLDAVNPKVAIISTGDYTEYGHPETELLDLLDTNGIEIYRTDMDGTIIIDSDGSDFTVTKSKGNEEDTGEIEEEE